MKDKEDTGDFKIPEEAFKKIKSWKDNWEELTAYFDYPMEIRKIIYTTNAIESLNSGIRKYTKTKTVFPDDQSALKAVYLAVNNV
jgi:putative transposase